MKLVLQFLIAIKKLEYLEGMLNALRSPVNIL